MTDVLGAALPEDWSASRFKNVVTYLSRGTAPDYVDEGPVRAISQAANQDGYLDWTRTRFHSFNGSASKLKGYLKVKDILINSTGTGTLGRVGFFDGTPDGIPCMADSHVTIVRTDNSVANSRFTYYWLRSQPFQDYMHSALIVGATNQIELNREGLSSAPLPLPPIEEQRRIADFLDAETARIDQLKGRRLQQLYILNERAYAQISETLVPGVLTRPSSERPWPWMPVLEEGRPLVRLGYICRLQNGITVDAKRSFASGFVTRPYLRVANVQAGHVDLSSVAEISVPQEMAKRSTLRRGDVLMTEGGDLDKLGRGTVWNDEIANCLHQNHVFALRPDPERLDGHYLAFLTRTVHGRCYFESTGSRTTNLASTNSNKILSFPVPLPSVRQQRELVEEVQRELDLISQHRTLLRRQVALLAERRQALITAAVTGQFDVSTASGRGVME